MKFRNFYFLYKFSIESIITEISTLSFCYLIKESNPSPPGHSVNRTLPKKWSSTARFPLSTYFLSHRGDLPHWCQRRDVKPRPNMWQQCAWKCANLPREVLHCASTVWTRPFQGCSHWYTECDMGLKFLRWFNRAIFENKPCSPPEWGYWY